jgi:hypothetical protein
MSTLASEFRHFSTQTLRITQSNGNVNRIPVATLFRPVTAVSPHPHYD